MGCQNAAPCLVQAYHQFQGRGVQFVGLTAHSQDMAKQFVKEAGFTWPNAYEAGDTIEALGLPGVVLFVVGRDGVIAWTDGGSRYSHDPALLEQELSGAISAALAQDAGAVPR